MKKLRTHPVHAAGTFVLSVIVIMLAGCSADDPVEQIRQRHDDTMGHPVKITYELGSDWMSQKWGKYSPVGIEQNVVSLTVDVESARVRGDDFKARLSELKKGPNNRRKRERLVADVIRLDERDAVEFAVRQESSRDHGVYFVSHRFEFIRGDYYIEIRLRARDDYYERYLEQLKHTANSVELQSPE